MSYQLPPLNDADEFERLVRDIARQVYNDPGIERFGRRGQAQDGIDAFSPANSAITFQCKLKDTRYATDDQLRKTLLSEMEDELAKTAGLAQPVTRFIFATTFKNDRVLQEKAASLSTPSTTLEYWGWDTINERIWEFADDLVPTYFSWCPIRAVAGFRKITPRLIKDSRTTNQDELNRLALDYYRINDRSDVVFKIVCNNLDVRNQAVMENVYRRLDAMPSRGTLWLLGDGGSGKTTILHRAALELAERDSTVFMLDLETLIGPAELQWILARLKFCSATEPTVLCVDNPAANEEILETLLREIPNYAETIHLVLSERGHRYHALRRTDSLTYLHGEEESKPLYVRNSSSQREDVYNKLFVLFGLSEADQEPLRYIIRNENLVYVNATYTILLELKKKRKIDFDFDWDDYRKAAADLGALSEGYKYIALFYLCGVRTPFSTFGRVLGATEAQQALFLSRFGGLVNEPIVVDERRDESFRKITHLRTKHEIVSEIFFREHPEVDKNELLMQWAEQTEFDDAVEAQALINIFGAKKYLDETPQIDFDKILEFLFDGYLSDRVRGSAKLSGALALARFWQLIRQNKSDEAIASLEAFVKTAPQDLHSRTELAKAYQRTRKLNEAEALLIEILQLAPNDLRARTELAKIYQQQDKLEQGEQVLLELLEIDRENIMALTELAKIYRRQGRLRDAENALHKVIQRRRFDLNSRTELGKVYQSQGKLDEAETILMEVLHLESEDLQARTELAKIYQRQGKLQEAEELLLQSLAIDKNQLHPRTELAKIYQRQGKLHEAEELLLQSLAIDKNQLHPRTELAKIYQRQGKLDQAETILMDLLHLEPENLQARTELAKIYQRQGKLDQAIQRLKEYIEIDPKGLHPRTELAKIYQRQGKLELAAKYAEESLKFDPLNDHAMSELLAIWSRTGESKKCVERFVKFISQPNYRFTRYSQAPCFRFFRCCSEFGLKDEATLVFKRFQSQLDDRNVEFFKKVFADS